MMTYEEKREALRRRVDAALQQPTRATISLLIGSAISHHNLSWQTVEEIVDQAISEIESQPSYRILAGIALIKKYEPNADFAASHDEIFFGAYETREQMTEEEQQQMEAWGWREMYDSWRHSV
jgi:hypothetical protein